MTFGILVDVTKCTSCGRCVSACVQENGLDRDRADSDLATTRDGLSANRLLSIVQVAEGRYARKSCMHCLTPSCVSACLVGGLSKTPEGPVVYDPEKCIGCRYCMLACPFQIPRYEWERTIPFMVKCSMCSGRIVQGRMPACVDACPNQALRGGERDSLLEWAHRIIKECPDRYAPHVWGEKEFGGTGVLYISDVDLSRIGWPEEAAPPIPSLTEPLVHKTPFIGLGAAACLLGVNWIVRRRMELARGDHPMDSPANNPERKREEADE
jgi:formate dehydrogenase iron-sulfur subunit